MRGLWRSSGSRDSRLPRVAVSCSRDFAEGQAIDDNTAVLLHYLEEHKVLAHPCRPRLAVMFFGAKTRNPSQAFCHECNRWVDLSEDAHDGQGDHGDRIGTERSRKYCRNHSAEK